MNRFYFRSIIPGLMKKLYIYLFKSFLVMRYLRSLSTFFFFTIIISLLFHQCKELIPDWNEIDFNRNIRGRIVDINDDQPVKNAVIEIRITSDALSNNYGARMDTLRYLTNDSGFYQTEKISESLWSEGKLIIKASKSGYSPKTWYSNEVYETGTGIWTSDNGNTLFVNFELEELRYEFQVSPDVLNFANNLTNLPIYIINTGTGKSDWEIKSSDSWLSYTPFSGEIAVRDFAKVQITINRPNLSSGEYTSLLEVSSSVADTTIFVPVFVTVD